MDLLEQLSSAVTGLSRLHERVVVGIDGPDGAGKTTLADHLADRLAGELQTTALRASVDGFLRPPAQRYRRGELSAQGYYLDGFDYPALRHECLLPFLGGASRLRTAAHDSRTEAEEDIYSSAVPIRAVLLIDGVFLLRPELRDLWTLSIYLRVSPEEALRSAHHRDLELFGSAEQVEHRYLARYLPGQAHYRRQADPEAAAHILVDNEHTDAPRIERWAVADVPST